MPVTVGAIILHMGPDTVGGPDSLEAPIIDFIGAAQSELLVSVQELDHRPIAKLGVTDNDHGSTARDEPVNIVQQSFLKPGF